MRVCAKSRGVLRTFVGTSPSLDGKSRTSSTSIFDGSEQLQTEASRKSAATMADAQSSRLRTSTKSLVIHSWRLNRLSFPDWIASLSLSSDFRFGRNYSLLSDPRFVKHLILAGSKPLALYWGDDTKVSELSGSQSYSDICSLGNSRWNTIFQRAPEATKVTAYRKVLFRDRNQTIKRMLCTFERRPCALRCVFRPLNRREFTVNAKNCPIWVPRTGQF